MGCGDLPGGRWWALENGIIIVNNKYSNLENYLFCWSTVQSTFSCFCFFLLKTTLVNYITWQHIVKSKNWKWSLQLLLWQFSLETSLIISITFNPCVWSLCPVGLNLSQMHWSNRNMELITFKTQRWLWGICTREWSNLDCEKEFRLDQFS